MHAYHVANVSSQHAYSVATEMPDEELASKLFFLIARDDVAHLAAVRATVDHLQRQADVATQTRGGKLKTRDLYTEAERILAKTAGGMSLLERLARDKTLRDDLLSLIKELQAEDTEDPPLTTV